MLDLTISQLLHRAAAFLIVAAIHGYALAGLARLLGDRGPSYDGRLTLNPLAHLDLIGWVGGILKMTGWIRPIAIDPEELRMGRFALVLCVVGSLLVPLLVVMGLQMLRVVAVVNLSDAAALTVVTLINTTVQMSVWFAVLNILPFPPLAGAHLLVAVSPALRPLLRRYHLAGVVVLAGLIASGLLQDWLRPAFNALGAHVIAR